MNGARRARELGQCRQLKPANVYFRAFSDFLATAVGDSLGRMYSYRDTGVGRIADFAHNSSQSDETDGISLSRLRLNALPAVGEFRHSQPPDRLRTMTDRRGVARTTHSFLRPSCSSRVSIESSSQRATEFAKSLTFCRPFEPLIPAIFGSSVSLFRFGHGHFAAEVDESRVGFSLRTQQTFNLLLSIEILSRT